MENRSKVAGVNPVWDVTVQGNEAVMVMHYISKVKYISTREVENRL